MTIRRMAVIAGLILAGFGPVGCATATIEDAVPAGALMPPLAGSPSGEAPAEQVKVDAGKERVDASSAERQAGDYPNLNVAPPVAAPQISAQKKAADRAELRAHQQRLVTEGQQAGISPPPSMAGAGPGSADLSAQGAGSAIQNDSEALRRLAATHGAEVLKQIEGN